VVLLVVVVVGVVFWVGLPQLKNAEQQAARRRLKTGRF